MDTSVYPELVRGFMDLYFRHATVPLAGKGGCEVISEPFESALSSALHRNLCAVAPRTITPPQCASACWHHTDRRAVAFLTVENDDDTPLCAACAVAELDAGAVPVVTFAEDIDLDRGADFGARLRQIAGDGSAHV